MDQSVSVYAANMESGVQFPDTTWQSWASRHKLGMEGQMQTDPWVLDLAGQPP